MKILHLRLFALMAIITLIACQDDSIVENSEEEIDQDMITASELAEEYLQSNGGRFGKTDKAITVLKYKDGVLLFDTNTDDHEGYQEVVETSITANVNPGDYIFWFAGGGLSEVDEIDFDAEAEVVLGVLPVDFIPQKMWIIKIPSDIENTELKYDIVYVPRETGLQIRLDPKITVGGQSDSETSD